MLDALLKVKLQVLSMSSIQIRIIQSGIVYADRTNIQNINFCCRNPDFDFEGSWCFVLADGILERESCDIELCPGIAHLNKIFTCSQILISLNYTDGASDI